MLGIINDTQYLCLGIRDMKHHVYIWYPRYMIFMFESCHWHYVLYILILYILILHILVHLSLCCTFDFMYCTNLILLYIWFYVLYKISLSNHLGNGDNGWLNSLKFLLQSVKNYDPYEVTHTHTQIDIHGHEPNYKSRWSLLTLWNILWIKTK